MTLEDEQPRKRLTLRDQVTILKCQAICPLCGKTLGDGPTRDEHMVARGLGGSEDLSNRRVVHGDCAKVKTTGVATKSSNRGTDLTEIARTKRLRAALEAHRLARAKTAPAPEKPATARRKWPSRPFPKRSTA